MNRLLAWMFSAGLLLTTGLAAAAGSEAFSDARFKALTEAGKPVVLDVHAEWCPTCQRQQPVLLKLVEAPPYQDFHVLVVDYDDQPDVRRRFKVASQSTLVVFKGASETGRATGITSPESIGSLLDSARK